MVKNLGLRKRARICYRICMKRKKKRIVRVLPLLGWIALCELAGVIGSVFTISAIPTWYAGLVKPDVRPPNWVFGPVWTTLYALMGIAGYLVWSKRRGQALRIFGVQLVLNATWSIIFFGLQSPGWALVNIVALWLAIVGTIKEFYRVSKPAAYLLVPYLVWVSFASYLNYSIWVLNRGI